MADSPWQAWVEVLPDFSNFSKNADGPLSRKLGSAGSSGGVLAGNLFKGSFLNILGGVVGANLITGIGFTIGRTIGDAISAGVSFSFDAVDLASALNEQQNAVKVAFGEAAGEIDKLSKSSLDNLFLSELSFDKIAVQFSNFSKTIAGQGGDVAGVIDTLTKRGADFASVYDIDVTDALALFQSGLAGETEPLRAYGIDLSAATVASFAYANGIAAQGKQLTEQQRVQAAYGALLQQTSIVQGDLANTGDSYANQQRKLAEAFKQSQTALGTALLPTFTEFLNLANEELIPVLDDVIAQIGPELGDALKEAAPSIIELIRQTEPLIPQLVELGINALPVVVQVLKLLVPLLTDTAANASSMYATFNALVSFLSGDTTFAEFGDTLRTLDGSLTNTALEVSNFAHDAIQNLINFASGVKAKLDEVIAFFTHLPENIRSSVGGLGQTLYTSGQDLINGLIQGVRSKAKEVADAALRVVRDAVKGVRDFLGIHSPSTLAAEMGSNYGQGWIDGIVGKIPEAKAASLSLVTPPAVPSPANPVSSDGRRVFDLGADTMRELLDALKVELVTDDTILASSAGRGSGFQTALGAT